MKYTKMLKVSKEDADRINRYLNVPPENESDCLGLNETITFTVDFGDGIEMDIKCCGVKFREGESNLSWTEAVLFNKGSEVACSEPGESFLGEWVLEYGGNQYCATVEVAEDSRYPFTKDIVAYENDGVDQTYAIFISVAYEKEGLDVIQQIKKAARYFVTETKRGQQVYNFNCCAFNWGDFVDSVPSYICEKFGFKIEEFRTVDSVVSLNEQIAEEG